MYNRRIVQYFAHLIITIWYITVRLALQRLNYLKITENSVQNISYLVYVYEKIRHTQKETVLLIMGKICKDLPKTCQFISKAKSKRARIKIAHFEKAMCNCIIIINNRVACDKLKEIRSCHILRLLLLS